MKKSATRLTGAALILIAYTLALYSPRTQANPRRNPLPYTQLQQQITGTVRDASGIPIPGVSVMLSTSNRGTTTTNDGNYTLTASPTDILVFSYIGYKTLKIPIQNRTTIHIKLQEDITSLGTVIVNAGYYNTTERESTGSITRISASAIEDQPVSHMLATMQGRMPGVFITQDGGVPGSGFQIQIRGQNSLRSEGNDPLYIIDGVPYSSQDVGDYRTGTAFPGGISPLTNIDPSSIASIAVLKDADATAIYGSRGANGVVLITTKKGTSGKTDFQMGYRYGIAQVKSHLNLLNTQEYLEMRKEAYANDGITDYPANAYDVNGTWDQSRYTDWQDVIIGNTAKYIDVNGSLSGGSASTRFRLGGNYHRETTVYPGDYSYHSVGIQTNTSHRSQDDRFQADLSASFTNQKNNLPEMASLITKIYQLAPNAPALYNPDGSLNWENSTWQNPFAIMENDYKSDSYNLMANAQLTYQLLPGLELETNLGYTETRFSNQLVQPSTNANPAFGNTTSNSSIRKHQVLRNSWIVEPQLSYVKDFGTFKTQVLVGSTFQDRVSSQLHLYGLGFSSNRLLQNMAAADREFISVDDETKYRYTAAFGRVNFSIRNRYFLNLTGRRDGSSRFGPGNKFSNFGAVGGAWIISSEPFLKEWEALSLGKLRGSYGLTGNDQIGDYQYQDTYSISSISYAGVSVMRPSRLFNPDFSWEINKKLELALETGFYEDRIFLTAAWYRNRSSNQLVGIPLPATTGFSTIQANLDATVENRGWEFTLATQNISNLNLSWKTSVNLSFPRNELLEFPDLEGSTYANQYVIGQPINIRKTYQYNGLDVQTGLYQFTDYNGDGLLTRQDDRESVCDLNPKYYGGFQNSLRYKGFNLDVLIQFVKQDNYQGNYLMGMPGTMVNNLQSVEQRWLQSGDEATYQPYSTGADPELYSRYLNYNQSDAMIGDASYIRLKNISLTYSLPDALLPGIDCRITLQGQNLLTITNYEGFDPESIYTNSIPPLQVFTTGIQLNF